MVRNHRHRWTSLLLRQCPQIPHFGSVVPLASITPFVWVRILYPTSPTNHPIRELSAECLLSTIITFMYVFIPKDVERSLTLSPPARSYTSLRKSMPVGPLFNPLPNCCTLCCSHQDRSGKSGNPYRRCTSFAAFMAPSNVHLHRGVIFDSCVR